MKPIYLKNVTVLDPGSDWHCKKASIFIENGVISKITAAPESVNEAEVFDGDGLYVSAGWLDLRANFCDPGYEYKEDIHSGIEAAAYGGFTGVAILPETEPRLAGKSTIEYVLRKAADKIVDVYPLASITTGPDQQDLTEMFDVAESGAYGFSSGNKSISDSGFLLRAMEYAGMTGMPLMVKADDKGLSGKGLVNEGIVSVKLGLKGIPDIAEEADIHTILKIGEYTAQPVHISCVSTKAGMQAIEAAQSAGIKVSADISIHHLYFEEEDLGMFDTSLKLRPPLRRAMDRNYLRATVLENEKITVVSDHNPHEEDKKHCEFELAAFGASGLQTVFAQLIGIYGIAQLEKIIEILTIRPSRVLGLNSNSINISSPANLTIFDPAAKWVLNDSTNRSKSRNSPLWGKELTGKALGIVNKGKLKILN
jgi:dihydroorotase